MNEQNMYQRCNCYSRSLCINKDSYSVSPSSTEYSNYLKAYGEVLANLIKDNIERVAEYKKIPLIKKVYE